MKDKVLITGIIAILIMVCFALSQGEDGVLLAGGLTAIVAVATGRVAKKKYSTKTPPPIREGPNG